MGARNGAPARRNPSPHRAPRQGQMHIDLAEASALIEGFWRQVRVATTFLTRIPTGTTPGPPAAESAAIAASVEAGNQGELAAASAWFPVLGVGIGAIAALALLITSELGLHPLACGFVAVAVAAALSGAMHEDGLADFADGLGGGHSPGERLDIMRDSRIGTFGTLAVVLSVCLRATLLSQFSSLATATAALIAACALSRAAMVPVMRWVKPARADGLAFDAGQPRPAQVTAALAIAALVTLAALDLRAAIAACATAACAAAAVALLARRDLGGQTGDVLGSVQQLAEIVALAAVAAAE